MEIQTLPETVITVLAKYMVECDPQAEVQLDLSCPACGYCWKMMFDIVSFFWSEICAQARRLLREVHTLARAYGWREADILSLSTARRHFYLEDGDLMADFLTRLAGRVLGINPTVQPIIAPMYAHGSDLVGNRPDFTVINDETTSEVADGQGWISPSPARSMIQGLRGQASIRAGEKRRDNWKRYPL